MKSKILYHGAHKLGRAFGFSAVGVLGILAFVLLSCPNLGSAGAISSSDFTANDVYDNAISAQATDGVGAMTQVWIKPSISVALDATTVSVDSSTAKNNFASQTTTFQVATNSTAGLKVYLNTQDVTTLNSTDETSPNKIYSITDPAVASEFPTDKSYWGYYVTEVDSTDTPTYRPAKTEASVVKETTTSGTMNKYKLGVGVKVNPETPTGIYQNRMVVSVVANPVAAFNLFSITRMQDMTPEICRDTPNYVSKDNYAHKSLLDDRGGTPRKSYEVAKLADGNCWMTQNLALNLGFEMTSSDTDLAPGAKVTLPATSTSSGGISANNNNLESRHPNNYWYYSWAAATAGSGTLETIKTEYQEAPDSICPKGWQLPLSGTRYNTIAKSGNPDKQLGSGSFYDLLISHGVTNLSTMSSIGEAAPLNFVRAGYVDSGQLGAVGQWGHYRSRVASSAVNAYYFDWASSNSSFNPSCQLGRYFGFSVRCVARQVAR